MTTEIRRTLSTIDSVVSVWGFGSLFRGSRSAQDVDIVVVIDSGDLPLSTIRSIRECFREIELRFSLPVDLTILTASEFAERPLIEMDALVPLFKR